jgi:hypothetical protein
MRNGERASVRLVQRRCEEQSIIVCNNLVRETDSSVMNAQRLIALQWHTRCDFDNFDEEQNVSWIADKCKPIATIIGNVKDFCKDTLDSLPDLRKEDGSWNWD